MTEKNFNRISVSSVSCSQSIQRMACIYSGLSSNSVKRRDGHERLSECMQLFVLFVCVCSFDLVLAVQVSCLC